MMLTTRAMQPTDFNTITMQPIDVNTITMQPTDVNHEDNVTK